MRNEFRFYCVYNLIYIDFIGLPKKQQHPKPNEMVVPSFCIA